jgi:hypothetical protein
MAEIFTQQFLLQQELGKLALKFRGSRSAAEEQEIARQYEQTVEKLVRSGTWDEVPGPEDQLPENLMPNAFFDYWKKRARDEGA